MSNKFRPNLNPDGSEICDSTPIETPLHINRPMSIAERVRSLVQGELSRRAAEQGHESFEEADDFDVGDDYDPTSPYEQNFDQQLAPLPDLPKTDKKTKKAKKSEIIEEVPKEPEASDEE